MTAIDVHAHFAPWEILAGLGAAGSKYAICESNPRGLYRRLP